MNVSARTQGFSVTSWGLVMIGSDRDPIGNSIWTISSDRILSYLIEQRDRARSHHLKYILVCVCRDLTLYPIKARIDSHHQVPNAKIIERFLDQLRFLIRSDCSRYRTMEGT